MCNDLAYLCMLVAIAMCWAGVQVGNLTCLLLLFALFFFYIYIIPIYPYIIIYYFAIMPDKREGSFSFERQKVEKQAST